MVELVLLDDEEFREVMADPATLALPEDSRLRQFVLDLAQKTEDYGGKFHVVLQRLNAEGKSPRSRVIEP